MTWEERERYQAGRSRLDELRVRLADGTPEDALSRGDALEILDLLEMFAERLSPERWDRTLEVIADEAARRADVMAARRN
jgi:hypothetical protein